MEVFHFKQCHHAQLLLLMKMFAKLLKVREECSLHVTLQLIDQQQVHCLELKVLKVQHPATLARLELILSGSYREW